jgi:hypothetical protein
MLVLNAYLHPQDPQYPVFDLMCVPSVMQRKCKGSKMPGAGLLQSPLPVVEDGSTGLRLCNSESPFSIPGGECPLRATRHHNNKWPECNCAAAILSLTSYSSQKYNNMTPLGKRMWISRHRHLRREGPVFFKIKSSFQLSGFCIEELKKKRPGCQPGRRRPIGKHHPSQHELLKFLEKG